MEKQVFKFGTSSLAIVVPKDWAVKRGIKRGIKRSSMPKDRAEKVWQELWKPMEDRYISQYHPDKKADIIIDGAKSYRDQIIT